MNSACKVALITGGGSGIGKHAALALLGEGYSLVLAGRRLARLEETIAAAGADGARALAVETDVGDPGSVAALFGVVRERFGAIKNPMFAFHNESFTSAMSASILTPSDVRTSAEPDLEDSACRRRSRN